MAWPKPSKGTAGASGTPEGSTSDTADVKARGVGATLREARERRGWSVADVAAYLRIRAPVLEAMEAGRFETLPSGAYALGFVRTYADFLGLDRDEVIRRVKAEAAAVATRVELNLPQPITESRLPSGVVIAVSALIAVAAYGVWYYQSSNTVAVPRVEAVPERLAGLVDRPQAQPSSPAKAEAAPISAPATESSQPAPSVASTEPAEPSPSEAPAAAAQAPAPASAPAPAPAPAPAAPAPQVAAVPPAATVVPSAAPTPAAAPKQYGETEGARILIRAGADSWLQVRDANGSVVFSRILRPGESYAPPNRPGYKLATGNAGVLEITVDGQKAPPIGRVGFTRKDVTLDPARILAGTAAPPERSAAPAPAQASPAPAIQAQPDRSQGG